MRPIHLPGAAGCELLRSRAQAALDAWAREWMSAEAPASLVVNAALECDLARPVEPWSAWRTNRGRCWFRRGANDRASFAQAIVGATSLSEAGECADEWTATVVERAAEALYRALCMTLLSVPVEEGLHAPPDTSLFAFGSGALHLSCSALGLHAITDAGVWSEVPPGERAVAQSLPDLTPLDRAMRRSAVRMEVVLGSVEVPAPKLLELACGDVLRLPERLDEGLTLRCEGRTVARVRLGEMAGRKCVQVTAQDA